jgi:hypothetical protein
VLASILPHTDYSASTHRIKLCVLHCLTGNVSVQPVNDFVLLTLSLLCGNHFIPHMVSVQVAKLEAVDHKLQLQAGTVV